MGSDNTFLSKLKTYALARLEEKSTWLGLLAMLASLGVSIAPNHVQDIAAAAAALVGALLAATEG